MGKGLPPRHVRLNTNRRRAACLRLNSVPLGKDAAVELVEAIEPYLEWQSDSGYLKDPPPGYFYPPHDLCAALAKVKENLITDEYANEYKFQEDLYVNVFGKAHNGHLTFLPDALTRVFEWGRQRALVSISPDGSSLPVIKVYEDVISSPSTASILTLINGVDASAYIQKHINKVTYNQDPDAAYNSMFYSKAGIGVDSPFGFFATGGRTKYIYPGPNTTFAFENGTVLNLENFAAVKANMTGVTDGPSYYARFCDSNGLNATTTALRSLVTADTKPPVVPGYPTPILIAQDGSVSGYYLKGEDVQDVAVIAVLDFEPIFKSEFQATTRDFFSKAVAAGKTKLIVDFQGNGGGIILLGYDFFRQLFPHVTQEDYSRWKESASFMAEARIASDLVAGVNPYTEHSEELVLTYQSWLNYRYDLNATNQPFPTFDSKFPTDNIYQSTPYTALTRWNLNDTLVSNQTFGVGIEITGYGSLSNASQPFKAEKIILLYDGVCASTCALASSFLKHQGNVKSVAMGGRPSHRGPIQGVGGVKGGQVLSFSYILSQAQDYNASAENDDQSKELLRFSDLPNRRSNWASVNVRDQILPGNLEDGIPAQFVNETADCRLWWTEGMIRDVSEVWKAAARAGFNGGRCVAGGIEREEEEEEGAKSEQEQVKGPTAWSASGVRNISETVEKAKTPVDEKWLAVHRMRVVV
ncbi:hypothetical protein QBC44DRAFT_357896 [Cladorrhinum sp. PSN332]|nr:hypothetical protein QBC44DRAFT_357896 [Cladorrhinum sp. PSN332]